MPSETPHLKSAELVNASAWFAEHPRIGIALAAFCLWVSVSLMIRIWVLYHRASFVKKLIWSIVLLVPLFGWLFYAGCFQIPGNNSTLLRPTDGVDTGGPSGGSWF